jgi:cysteine desulfurase / selenocysteine lyase
LVGWKSVVSHRDFALQKLEFPDSARRYEPGSLNAMGVVGIHAALALLKRAGIPNIATRLGLLRERLVAGIQSKGYRIVGAASYDRPTGITSFRGDGDMTEVYKKIDAQRVVVSLRDDPAGGKCVRVAPHFYTTETEIDRFLACL